MKREEVMKILNRARERKGGAKWGRKAAFRQSRGIVFTDNGKESFGGIAAVRNMAAVF